MATILKAGNVASGAQITSDSTGILEIKTGTGAGTTAMVLDASQNVGIGTSSPDSFANFVFVEAGSNVTKQGVFQATDGTTKVAMYSTSGLGIVSTRTAHPLALFTNGSERMRIDTSGNLLVGSTSSPATARTYLKGVSATSSDFALLVQNSADTDMNYVRNDGLFSTGVASQSPYNKTTASAANVFVDSGGVLNRSTSSIKYKQNVKDAVHGLSDLLNLRAVTYEGKSEEDAGKTFGGLLAEEVHNAGLTEFVQYADDGSPDALAYGNMVSLCIKAIQELKAELDATKAEVALLKGAA
jgi:hypothetical protein